MEVSAICFHLSAAAAAAAAAGSRGGGGGDPLIFVELDLVGVRSLPFSNLGVSAICFRLQ